MLGLASKLSRANSILSNLRHFVSSEILRSVYFAIFQSHKNYICLAWGLTRYPQHKISILPKKALRIITFAPFNTHKKCFKNAIF